MRNWTALPPMLALRSTETPFCSKFRAWPHSGWDVAQLKCPVRSPENVRSCFSVVGQDAAPVITGGPDGAAEGEDPHATDSNGTISTTNVVANRFRLAPRQDLVPRITREVCSEEREPSK